MDLIYPYATDPHGGLELIYSLRSIEKYLTGYGQVFIIGDKPKWLKNVIHVPLLATERAMSGRKEFNIMSKIKRACEDERVSDEFIMVHDDHFLLRPLDVKEFDYWHNGSLQDALKKAHSGYKRTVQNTIDYNMGSGNNSDIHVPIVFNKGKFLSYVCSAPWHQKEFCIKSLYAHTMGGEYMEDCKINSPLTRNQFYDKIAGRLFFSTGPYFLQGDNFLEELYSEKSKFEL